MARGRVVSGDRESAEFDALRYTVHTILMMLENLSASVAAGATLQAAIDEMAAGIAAGIDNNPGATANVVTTGREVLGVIPNPTRPPRYRSDRTLALDPNGKSV